MEYPQNSILTGPLISLSISMSNLLINEEDINRFRRHQVELFSIYSFPHNSKLAKYLTTKQNKFVQDTLETYTLIEILCALREIMEKEHMLTGASFRDTSGQRAFLGRTTQKWV